MSRVLRGKDLKVFDPLLRHYCFGIFLPLVIPVVVLHDRKTVKEMWIIRTRQVNGSCHPILTLKVEILRILCTSELY